MEMTLFVRIKVNKSLLTILGIMISGSVLPSHGKMTAFFKKKEEEKKVDSATFLFGYKRLSLALDLSF